MLRLNCANCFQIGFCREGFSANRAKFMNQQSDWLFVFSPGFLDLLRKLGSSLLSFCLCLKMRQVIEEGKQHTSTLNFINMESFILFLDQFSPLSRVARGLGV